MNIFVTSADPCVCARELDDARVVKMTLETAQILSTVLGLSYKPTHRGHPCVRWAGQGLVNTGWLTRLGRALAAEYQWRFGRRHRSADVICEVDRVIPAISFRVPASWVVCGDGGENGETAEPFARYRGILLRKWSGGKRPPRWTRREPPAWFNLGMSPGTRAADTALKEDTVNDTESHEGEDEMATKPKVKKAKKAPKPKKEKVEKIKDTFNYGVDWAGFPDDAPTVRVDRVEGEGGEYPTERGAKRAARKELREASKIIRGVAQKLRGKPKAK